MNKEEEMSSKYENDENAEISSFKSQMQMSLSKDTRKSPDRPIKLNEETKEESKDFKSLD
jgi:hypothetical protein